jgi:hypothetical protein
MVGTTNKSIDPTDEHGEPALGRAWLCKKVRQPWLGGRTAHSRGSLSELRDASMTLAGVIRHYEIDDSGSTTDQLVDETLNIVDEFEKWGRPFGLKPAREKEN